MKYKAHKTSRTFRLIISSVTFCSFLIGTPVITNSVYNPDSNILSLTFSEPVLTFFVDLNLLSLSDEIDQMTLSGAELMNTDSTDSEISFSLLTEGIIDSTNYGQSYEMYYLWGKNISLVQSVEHMDPTNISIISGENAFFGVSGEPSSNQILPCEIQAASDLPVVVSASYNIGTNLLSIVFSEPVQFDQIAEDRSCNFGTGNCPGNGQMDGNPSEDRNGNGVLDMEPNINSDRIGFQDDTGNTFWLEGYREILQTGDSEQIDMRLTTADAHHLEMYPDHNSITIKLQLYSFLNTNYNPVLQGNYPLAITEDDQPLVADSAAYDLSLNELQIFFPGARDITVSNPAPVFTNFHFSNGVNEISLSGINQMSHSGSTLILTELTFADQAALEGLILTLPQWNSLTISVDSYSVFDVNGNGNLEITELPVTISGEFNNPVLSGVSFDAPNNRLTLDWSPHQVVFYHDNRIFEDPEEYSINGIVIQDTNTNEIFPLTIAHISRDGSKQHTFLDLPDDAAGFIESHVNSGHTLSMTLQEYTFYSSGNTNNNGNMFEESTIYYIIDDSGPVITAVHLDEANRLLILNFDDNVTTSSLDFSTVNLQVNNAEVSLTGLDLIWESDIVTEARFLIPETAMTELMDLIPQNEEIRIRFSLDSGTAVNLDNSENESFSDLNGNGVWDDMPEPFDDFGSDGLPDEMEEGYPGSCSIPFACTDPAYDNQQECEEAGGCSDPQYLTEAECLSNIGSCSIHRWHDQAECEDHGGIWTPDAEAWIEVTWLALTTQDLCNQFDGEWYADPDPAGDDYDLMTNPEGTEGNGIWDPGEAFQDIYPNGQWDVSEPVTVSVAYGRYIWNRDFRVYPENPEQIFCLQKYVDENAAVYVEENAWKGYCKDKINDEVFTDLQNSEECYTLNNWNNNHVWVNITSEDILDLAAFFSENIGLLEENYGEPSDIDNNGRIIITLYDIIDEFSKGANDANQNLFAHGYFSNDDSGADMTNTGEMIYLDISPQYLYTGDGDIPDFGTMNNALVHEFTKMLITRNEPEEETWLKEGLAYLEQKRLLGEAKFFGNETTPAPAANNQLTYIGFSKKNRSDQYNIYLFLQYLSEKFTHTDGWDIIDAIALNYTASGMESVNDALLSLGFSQTTEDIFSDFATACLLDIPQEFGIYNGMYNLEAADLYDPLSSKNAFSLKFDDTQPPPYGMDDILPWSFGYYLIQGFSVSLLDNSLSLKSPLLDPADTLRFDGNHDIRYRMKKIMMRSGFTEPIDPLYEVTEMNINPNSAAGELPVTTNSIVIDGDTLDFIFRDYWGNCSNPDYNTQTDCENTGNVWTWEGNQNAVLVVTKTDPDNILHSPEYAISNSAISGPPPTGLQSTPISDAVHLWWSAPPPMGNADLQSFQVLRKSGEDNTFQPIVSGWSDLTYDDATALAGVTYTYAVAAEYEDGTTSGMSNEVGGWLLTAASVGFRTAVTNYGSIGDPNSLSTGRPSCEYPYGSDNNYLYDAGLWIGAMKYDTPVTTTYFYYPDVEWQPCAIGGPVRPVKSFFILDADHPVQEMCFDDLDPHTDSEHEPLGLRILNKYELSSPVENPDTGELEAAPWTKITYSIINSGMSGDLDQLFVGLWMDFDVSSLDTDSPHIDDLVDYDPDLKLSFMYDGDNPASGMDDTGENGLSSGYVGLALLRSPTNTVASHAWWNWENDPGTDEERYEFMNATHPAMEGYSFYPNPLDLGYSPFDYRILQTTGPFSLAAEDTLNVEYLLVFGDDHDDLRRNVMTALTMESQTLTGDLNFDFSVDVLDIVVLVDIILYDQPPIPEADLNGDNNFDILDVVILVNIILDNDTYRGNPLSEARVEIAGHTVKIFADAPVAGIQFNVDGDFEIIRDFLPDGWELHYNAGIILIFNTGDTALHSSELFRFDGNLSIKSVLVAGGDGHGIYADFSIPYEYKLYDAYPNPFNPATTISYALPEKELVKIVVYDLQGREVTRLVNSEQNAGYHAINWNADRIASGIYFIRMASGNFTKVQKVMILK